MLIWSIILVTGILICCFLGLLCTQSNYDLTSIMVFRVNVQYHQKYIKKGQPRIQMLHNQPVHQKGHKLFLSEASQAPNYLETFVHIQISRKCYDTPNLILIRVPSIQMNMSDTTESAASNLSQLCDDERPECHPSQDAQLLRTIVPKLVDNLESRTRSSININPSYPKASRINQLPSTNLPQLDYIWLNKANILATIVCKGHRNHPFTLREVVTLLVQHQIQNQVDSPTAMTVRTIVQNLIQQHARGEDIHCTQLLSNVQNALRDVSLSDMDNKFSQAVDTLIANKCFDYIVSIGDDKSY